MLYYVIPYLVEQPTWGGEYIANTKKISLKNKLIGQSYEFSPDSYVVPVANIAKLKPENYPYYLGSNDITTHKLHNKVKGIVKLKDLNKMDVFGINEIPDILIKFTQAKGNSYQIHPKTHSGKFYPKAESWHFFQKGKVTLGVKPNVDVEAYKEVCKSIYEETKKYSKAVKAKKITVDEARKELKRFIELHNPQNFVNVEILETNAVVENTKGGIHHSWEEDNSLIPDGNIVYEVQQNMPDSKSTIRAFDKGNLIDDGSYRELQIEEYFKNLVSNRMHNDPKSLMRTRIKLKDLKNWKLNKFFRNEYYQMDELVVVSREYKIDNLGFRHLFVKEGEGVAIVDGEEIPLAIGHSYLLTSDVKELVVKNTAKKEKDERPKLKVLFTYPGKFKF